MGLPVARFAASAMVTHGVAGGALARGADEALARERERESLGEDLLKTSAAGGCGGVVWS